MTPCSPLIVAHDNRVFQPRTPTPAAVSAPPILRRSHCRRTASRRRLRTSHRPEVARFAPAVTSSSSRAKPSGQERRRCATTAPCVSSTTAPAPSRAATCISEGRSAPRRPALGEEPDPGAGISIFPRSRYRYYLRATELIEAAGGEDELMLGFELHRFDVTANRWTAEGDFAAELRRGPAPPGYPSRDDFLRGSVRDRAGRHDGDLTVGWVSPHLRRAVIQIDCLAGCEAPLANVKGADWRALLAEVGLGHHRRRGRIRLPGTE